MVCRISRGFKLGSLRCSIRHRLPGDPGHRYFRFVTGADPLASRQSDCPELQLSLFRQARRDQRIILSDQWIGADVLPRARWKLPVASGIPA
jgi:hypothetical protein